MGLEKAKDERDGGKWLPGGRLRRPRRLSGKSSFGGPDSRVDPSAGGWPEAYAFHPKHSMKALFLLFTLGASLQAAEYFTARNGSDTADGRSEKTAFATVSRGSHLTIRRCFHDGREISGYVPAFVIAFETENLLLENDVLINGMGEGLTALRCPDLTVRHCVFYNNFIRALTVLQYTPKRVLNLSHNLFCDNLPQKYNNSLLRVSPLASLHSDDNVYFARLQAADRHLVETNDIHGKLVGHQGQGQYYGENLVLADVQKLAEQEKNSRFGNPGIRVAPELLAANTPQMEWQKVELHWNGKQFAPLDFADFMSDGNNPIAHAADGEASGLDPRAFQASAR